MITMTQTIATLAYLIGYIAWIFWAIKQGRQEAFLYIGKDSLQKLGNGSILPQISSLSHKSWIWERIFVFAGFIAPAIAYDPLIGIAYGFCLLFTFSFWHNGYYYLERNELADLVDDPWPYPKGFKHDKGKTATIEFSFKARSIFFGVGLCGMILILIRHYIGY